MLFVESYPRCPVLREIKLVLVLGYKPSMSDNSVGSHRPSACVFTFSTKTLRGEVNNQPRHQLPLHDPSHIHFTSTTLTTYTLYTTIVQPPRPVSVLSRHPSPALNQKHGSPRPRNRETREKHTEIHIPPTSQCTSVTTTRPNRAI